MKKKRLKNKMKRMMEKMLVQIAIDKGGANCVGLMYEPPRPECLRKALEHSERSKKRTFML